jgi:hypothetical protein
MGPAVAAEAADGAEDQVLHFRECVGVCLAAAHRIFDSGKLGGELSVTSTACGGCSVDGAEDVDSPGPIIQLPVPVAAGFALLLGMSLLKRCPFRTILRDGRGSHVHRTVLQPCRVLGEHCRESRALLVHQLVMAPVQAHAFEFQQPVLSFGKMTMPLMLGIDILAKYAHFKISLRGLRRLVYFPHMFQQMVRVVWAHNAVNIYQNSGFYIVCMCALSIPKL